MTMNKYDKCDMGRPRSIFQQALIRHILIWLAIVPAHAVTAATDKNNGDTPDYLAGEWEMTGEAASCWTIRTDPDGVQKITVTGSTRVRRRDDGLTVRFDSLSVTRDPATSVITRATLAGKKGSCVAAVIPAISGKRVALTLSADRVVYSVSDRASGTAVMTLSSTGRRPVVVTYGEDRLDMPRATVQLPSGDIAAAGPVTITLAARSAVSGEKGNGVRRRGFSGASPTTILAAGGMTINRTSGVVTVRGPVVVTQPEHPGASLSCGSLTITMDENAIRRSQDSDSKTNAETGTDKRAVSERFLAAGFKKVTLSGSVVLQNGALHVEADSMEFDAASSRLTALSPGGEVRIEYADPVTGAVRAGWVKEGVRIDPDRNGFEFLGESHFSTAPTPETVPK